MSTNFTDTHAAALTADAAKWLSARLDTVQGDLRWMRSERDRLFAELVAMDMVITDLEDTEIRYQARLNQAVPPLPPLDLGGEPERQQPLEREAREAALAEQAHAGRDPYGPATIPHLPRFTDRVEVEGSGEAESLVGGVSR